MKKLIILSIVIGSTYFCFPVFSQNEQMPASSGLPGDNLNLYGVLNLFQESETLEGFEQKLNAEDSKINNLDLDGDGRIDYIKIIDHINGNIHTIVLQDIINERESQDLAVIVVERDNNDKIQIQIIGDEQLYGKDYIIEPAIETPNPGYSGNSNTNDNSGVNTTVVNNNYSNSNDNHGNSSGYIYAAGNWRIIRFIYAPSYIAYVSPWRWSYYPSYWQPWHQVYYNDYGSYWHNHHSYRYYHQSHSYRAPAAQSYYGPRRTSSNFVHQRFEKGEYNRTNNRNNINSNGKSGNYRQPQNNPKNNREQYRGENRKSSSEKNSTYNRSGSNNNRNANTKPAERPNRKSEVKPRENRSSKSNNRGSAKQGQQKNSEKRR